ncbi:MAG: DUF2807 domain-containing protein [Ignavibacteriales bacterium]|jgi:hypothetical protein|nr:DUF2807 domain-containing protein [Ignavibacteriales bacterium]
MKKKTLLLLFVSLALFNACNFWGVRGNGKVKLQNRSIEEFDRLEIGGAFVVKVEVGKSPSIKISAEENLLPLIRTKINDGTLVIDSKKGLSPRREIKILITTPNLNFVEASGANDIEIVGVNEDEFEVNLSGAGTIDLNGSTNKLIADLSGAGTINAKNLKANDVDISVSGAASASVFAKESLDASVSGVGSIDYYGNPAKIKTNISGVGSINRK